MNEDNADIFAWVDEIEKKLEIDYDKMAFIDLLAASCSVNRYLEIKRLREQTFKFTHSCICNSIAANLYKLNIKNIQREKKLINGRIDIFGIDNAGNNVGVEVKKRAGENDYQQFLDYNKEIKKLYGDKFRLIVMSSCYTYAVLKSLYINNPNIEIWRYELDYRILGNQKKSSFKICKVEFARYSMYDSTNKLIKKELF